MCKAETPVKHWFARNLSQEGLNTRLFCVSKLSLHVCKGHGQCGQRPGTVALEGP